MGTKFGILDFIPRESGFEVKESFDKTVELAQYAEELVLDRYWVGEHHSTPSLMSSSPLLVLSRLGAETERIKLGSGGVMLDNISSFQAAENFKVLQAMYPGRIEAGLGHSAPAEKAMQISKDVRMTNPSDYQTALKELSALLSDKHTESNEGAKLRAMPTIDGAPVPMHMLMTSRRNAQFAGEEGLGMVFGLYLKPDLAECREAIKIYREAFKPSEMLKHPNVTIAIFAVTSSKPTLIPALEMSLNHWIVTFAQNKRSVYQLLGLDEISDYTFTNEEKEIISSFKHAKVVGTSKKITEDFSQLKEFLDNDDFLIVNQLPNFIHRKKLIEVISKIKI